MLSSLPVVSARVDLSFLPGLGTVPRSPIPLFTAQQCCTLRVVNDLEPLTDAERKLLQAVQTGAQCDLSQDGDANRTVRAAVLKAILSGEGEAWGIAAGAAIDLRGAVVSGDLGGFGGSRLPPIQLTSCRFEDSVDFSGATFTGDAGFNEATFTGDAGFDGATFTGDAGFGGATFTGDAGFGGATFTGDAWFGEATFAGDAGSARRPSRRRRFAGDLHRRRRVRQGDLHPATPGSAGRPSPATPVRRGDLHRRRRVRPRRPSPATPGSARRPSPATPSSTGRPSPATPGSRGAGSSTDLFARGILCPRPWAVDRIHGFHSTKQRWLSAAASPLPLREIDASWLQAREGAHLVLHCARVNLSDSEFVRRSIVSSPAVAEQIPPRPATMPSQADIPLSGGAVRSGSGGQEVQRRSRIRVGRNTASMLSDLISAGQHRRTRPLGRGPRRLRIRRGTWPRQAKNRGRLFIPTNSTPVGMACAWFAAR